MLRARKIALPPFARSLSARLLLLTVGFVMLAEILIYAPSVANYRTDWLREKADSAHLAILALEAAPEDSLSDALKANLLRRAGAYAVVLTREDRRLLLYSETPPAVDVTVTLGEGGLLASIRDAFAAMARDGHPTLRLIEPTGQDPDRQVEVVMDEALLRADMLSYSRNILLLSVVISITTAAFLYLTLQWLMVAPMRRITEGVTEFARNPQDPDTGVRESARGDEIGVAQSVLVGMQNELRAALRQQEHLAALGSAVSKINHDLRGILSTAVLLSDRLSGLDDPEVKRIAPPLIQSIDRAIALCAQTLDYARGEGPELSRTRFRLRELIDEVASDLALFAEREATAPCEGPHVVNEVPGDTVVEADRDQLYRVFANLGRNAFQAGARRVRFVHCSGPDVPAGSVVVDVIDDGPGLSTQARESLFRPFTGSARKGGTGLGLVIARDVMRAHRGDLALEQSGDHGTTFRVTLPST